MCRKLSGDQNAPCGGQHVGSRRRSLGSVPRSAAAAVFNDIVSVQRGGVPEGEQALADQAEGDRPPYCLFGPVARLTDAGDLLGLLEGHFDGPAGSVPFDDLRGRREQIGGDQCDVVAAGTAVTDQDQSNRLGAEGQVPEQLTMGDLDGGHGAVPGHRPLPPVERRREIRDGGESLALGPRPSTLARWCWSEAVEDGVGAWACGPTDARRETPKVAARVGGVAGDVDDSIGKALGELLHQSAGDDDLRALLPQRAEHRQADRARAEGQPYHDAEHDKAVAEADGGPSHGRAIVTPACPEDLAAGATEQRVIDDELDGRISGNQALDDKAGGVKPDPLDRPPSVGEEAVSSAVVPALRQPGAREHAAHIVLADLGEEAGDHGRERGEGRSREQRPEAVKQRGECCGKIAAEEHWRSVSLSGVGVTPSMLFAFSPFVSGDHRHGQAVDLSVESDALNASQMAKHEI